ncbi:MAG: extracellular solute-binding protein [Phycisphaerae bacterium]
MCEKAGFHGVFWPALLLGALLAAGCERQPVVVVYTSVDQQFAQEILQEFSRRTRVRVEAVYDSEAGKTTGLVRRLEREAAHPRCDVWWSSEVFGTIELARRGVLAAYESPAAADLPAEWRSSTHMWTCSTARARVAVYRTDRWRAEALPTRWLDFGAPEWAPRLAIANPQFGTTRGHLAALFAYHGESAGRAFLESLRSHAARIADGNAQVVALVNGEAAAVGMTDTDDVWVAQRRGQPVDLVYPALADDLPALWIPCTVALIAAAPHEPDAKRLVDFLVSAEVERRLAMSDSRNVPLRSAERAGLDDPHQRRTPERLDYDRIADALPAAASAARDILLR